MKRFKVIWEDKVNLTHRKDEDGEDYHKIAGYNYCKIKYESKDIIVLESVDSDKEELFFLEKEGIMFIKRDKDKELKLIERNKKYFIEDGITLTEIKELKDQDKINKLRVIMELK